MSNESSASEITPLRPERTEDVTNTPPGAVINNVATNLRQPNAIPTTVGIANYNNNNIAVRLDRNINIESSNHTTTTTTTIIMDTNKRILCRIGLDILVMICVGFPILCYFLWGKPYKRGFFCDDESLMHPFKESTVASWMLYIIGLVIPVSVIVIVEVIQSQHNAASGNINATSRKYIFMEYEIPDWLLECYKKIGVYGFGAAVGQLTTDIAKYSIGRLRPHFFAVCQPLINGNTTCSDPLNSGKYIIDFECSSQTSSKRMLKEVGLSFPSGHSSFTFFAMVYMALYLQSRMTWRGSKLLRHFLQFAFIMVAWYTALSRVSDYKHHWSDVLAGSAIGALTALVVANFVSDLFPKRTVTRYVLPQATQEDRPQQTITTNGH